MIGHVITLGILLVAGGIAFGALRQTVKDQPKQMRLEAKLEIKEQIDKHCADYIHDRASAVAIQAVPRES